MIFVGKLLQEALRQRNNIFPALPQGWQADVNGINTVIKVFAEPSVPHKSLQVHICSANQADINGNWLRAAHTGNRPVLDSTEQLGLQMQRNISDLVQEQSTALRKLKLACMVCMGIGESPFYMTEQLTFKKRFCDSSGVYCHHRLTTPEAASMNLPRKDILAGSVFSGDKDGCVGRSNFADGSLNGGHGGAGAPEHGIAGQAGNDGHARL